MKKKIINYLIGILIISVLSLAIMLAFIFFKEDKKEEIKKEDIKEEELVVEKYSAELKEKLEKIEFINEKINYFDIDKLDRYIEYYQKNKELDLETVVLWVNIGLDRPHYTNMENVENFEIDKILVNKYYSLGSYVPDNLVKINYPYSNNNNQWLQKEAAEAFINLAKEAGELGYTIRANSAYRSYKAQEMIYNSYLSQHGRNTTDTFSARPGSSEHQSGLAVDVNNGNLTYTSFKNTKEYQWMKENAHKYGFIQRYTAEKQKITGYVTEEWHYRYLGVEMASKVYESGLSFEEYHVMYIQEYKKDLE